MRLMVLRNVQSRCASAASLKIGGADLGVSQNQGYFLGVPTIRIIIIISLYIV